jgi:hypothetical protein
MRTLELLTTENPGCVRGIPVRATEIIGVDLEDRGQLLQAGIASNGYEVTQTLLLEDNQADRLYQFFDKTKAHPSLERQKIDCFSFASYVMDWTTEVDKRITYVETQPHNAEDGLERGQPYFICDTKDKKLSHAVIGWKDPGYNLSVLGLNGPLAITPNKILAQAYGQNFRKNPANIIV